MNASIQWYMWWNKGSLRFAVNYLSEKKGIGEWFLNVGGGYMVVHCPFVFFSFFWMFEIFYNKKEDRGIVFSSVRNINPETSLNAGLLTLCHTYSVLGGSYGHYFARSCFCVKYLLYGCSLLRTLKIFPLYRVWIYKSWGSLIKVKKQNKQKKTIKHLNC